MSPIRVISLLRSSARRERFAALNAHLPFAFFDAIDGSQLSTTTTADARLFGQGLPYVPGAYGAALSHLALWDECVARNEALTVAEDDAVFRLDFAAAAEKALRDLPRAWDIIVWGWNLDFYVSLTFLPPVSSALVRFDPTRVASSIAAFQRGTDAPALLALQHAWGGPAYSISPAGAAKLKEKCFPLQRFEMSVPLVPDKIPNVGIDSAMSRAYAEMGAWISFPPLALTENDRRISTIQQAPRRKGALSRAWRKIRP